MPKMRHEFEQKIMSLMNIVLVRQPDITISEMKEALERAGHVLNKNYVHKLLRKIEKTDRHYLDTQSLSEEIADFEKTRKAVESQLWALVLDSTGMVTPMVKSVSLRTLLANRKMVFETKFDAGVFERQLGKLKTEAGLSDEQKKNLDDLIKNVFRTTKDRGGK